MDDVRFSAGWLLMEQNINAYMIFAMMVVAALVLGATPLGRPLKWAETFYHEISHGLICLLTFGRVSHIQLHLKGGGACYYRGGFEPLIALAGYAGAALWGGLLYFIGADLDSGVASLWLKLEIGLLALVWLFYVRKTDLQTTVILLILGGIYGLALWWPRLDLLPWVVQFLGIYVMLNAIRMPLVLIDGQHVGDGAALQDMFVIIPEIVWVLLWFLFALLVLVVCAAATLPGLAMMLPRWVPLV